jgi:hypothetical protein
MSPRTLLAGPVAVLVLALLPASAAADGLPAVGIDARPLSLPGGHVAYMTKSAKHSTRVLARSLDGRLLSERRIDGTFSLPAVAYDGTPSGLSANSRTLILISPRERYPRKRTTFAVVDAQQLTVRRRISLKGDFSFDAISPNGRTMYLVEYNPREFGEYEVRAYDLRAGRLLRKPIVDPNRPDWEMYGLPMTRTPSPDGRWAYTLYDSHEHPFVHALDTSGRTAVCIALDDLQGDLWGATLDLNGPNLDVTGRGGRLLARIDTRTHEVIWQIPAPKSRKAAADERAKRLAAAAAARRTDDAEADAGISWLPLALPTAAFILLALAGRRLVLKRRAAAPISGAWEQSSDRHAPTA